ncbi:MAG: TonB-dependent receptor [Cyclobacteriaceae bacterium]|nr:TonB-dependent receptor [Cyclobacteriaceae bacterium]
MKSLLTILFLFNAAVLLARQNCSITLSGKVLDESNRILAGATVQLANTNQGQATDAGGHFRFENLCKGNYTVLIHFLGYEPVEKQIELNANKELQIALTLSEKLLQAVVVEDRATGTTPSTTTTLGARVLNETSGKTLGETLQQISGVNTIQSGPAIFKPVIHGVHSQRILILNNGIRQEGQQWGAEHAPEIDPFVAENLTVIKDAGAIKYGTDALGGVIVVTPAELPVDEKTGGALHLVGNSNSRAGTVSGLLEGSVKKIKGWGWRAQGTLKQSGDSQTPDYVLSNTGFREQNFSLATGYHGTTKGLEVFYSRFNTTIGILRGSASGSSEDLALAMERSVPQYTTDFTYHIREPRQEVTHNLIKINGHLQRGRHVWNAQYGLQINNRKEFDVRRGAALSQRPALAYTLYTHTLDAERETTLSEFHSRCVGLNGMVQDNNKIDGTQTLPFIPNFRNYSAGIFWIEKITREKVTYDFGLRYDYRLYQVAGFNFQNKLYKTQFSFGNVTATAGTTFKLTGPLSLTSTLGSTWRPPNVAELYSLGTHQSAAAIEYGLLLDEITSQIKELKGSSVKPEHAVKWVNTFKLAQGKWQAELSGYINYIFNYIYLKPRGITDAGRGPFAYFRYTQTEASFLGADASAQYEIVTGLSVRMSASLLRAKDERQNDYLIFIPSNRVETSIRYEKKTERKREFYMQARIKYVARQTRAPRVVTPQQILEAKQQGIDLFETDTRNFDFMAAPAAYTLGSLQTGYTVPVNHTKLNFQLSVDNLTNTRYREYTNRMRYFANDIGRNISASINFTF